MCDFLKKLVGIKSENIAEKTSQPIGESNLTPYTAKITANSERGQTIYYVTYETPAPITKIKMRVFMDGVDITDRLEDVSYLSSAGLFFLCTYVFRDPQTSLYFCFQDYETGLASTDRQDVQANKTCLYRSFLANDRGLIDVSSEYSTEVEIIANAPMSWTIQLG